MVSRLSSRFVPFKEGGEYKAVDEVQHVHEEINLVDVQALVVSSWTTKIRQTSVPKIFTPFQTPNNIYNDATCIQCTPIELDTSTFSHVFLPFLCLFQHGTCTMFLRLRLSLSSHSHYCMMRLKFLYCSGIWRRRSWSSNIFCNVLFMLLKISVGCKSVAVVFKNRHIVHNKHLINLTFSFIYVTHSLICAHVNAWIFLLSQALA